MLVQRGALQLGQVKGDGRGRVLVLAEQVMAGEVVAREGNQLWRRVGAFAREDLSVDMAGEVLDAYLAEAGLGGDWGCQSGSEHVVAWRGWCVPCRLRPVVLLPSAVSRAWVVAHRRGARW